jgi:3-hydroxyisobutyrate dehydrogenase-like beta-hydroxyacid dehydrogenase
VKIGFIGLGVMGNPMAQNIQRSGQHQLKVFDLDPARCEAVVVDGAELATTMAEAMRDVDLVMTSLPGPKQIEAVAFSDQGLFTSMRKGSLWIDLSTNNLEIGTRIKQAALARQIDILDAPVSGGDEGARAGSLTILVGGNAEVFKQALPILELIGEHIVLLGDSGAGYAAKISQVVLCYLHSLALSEALMLGVKGGVNPQQMLSIIQNSTGKSYVADRYGPPILDGSYDPSFTVGLAHKDMSLALQMAEGLGIQLPMCDLTTETYARAIETFGFEANHLKAVRLLEQDNDTFLQCDKPVNH